MCQGRRRRNTTGREGSPCTRLPPGQSRGAGSHPEGRSSSAQWGASRMWRAGPGQPEAQAGGKSQVVRRERPLQQTVEAAGAPNASIAPLKQELTSSFIRTTPARSTPSTPQVRLGIPSPGPPGGTCLRRETVRRLLNLVYESKSSLRPTAMATRSSCGAAPEASGHTSPAPLPRCTSNALGAARMGTLPWCLRGSHAADLGATRSLGTQPGETRSPATGITPHPTLDPPPPGTPVTARLPAAPPPAQRLVFIP